MSLARWIVPVIAVGAPACRSVNEPPAGLAFESPPLIWRDRADELIERTNDLRSFVAEYECSASEPGVTTLRVVYAAPNTALVVRSSPEVEHHSLWRDGVHEACTTRADGTTVRSRDDVRGTYAAHAQPIVEALREELPGADLRRLEWDQAGAVFTFECLRPPGGARPRAEFDVGLSCPRLAVLDWLRELREREDGTEDAEGRIVFDNSGVARMTFSTSTGFLERVDSLAPDRPGCVLQLTRLELDPDPTELVLELPCSDQPLPPPSPEMARSVQIRICNELRQRVFETLATQIPEESTSLDEDSRARIFRVLQAMHEEFARERLGSWIESTDTWIDQCSAWVRLSLWQRRQAGHSDSPEVGKMVSEWRVGLSTSIATVVDGEIRSLTGGRRRPTMRGIGGEFQAVELSALEAVLERRVRKPLTDRFETEVEGAYRDG